MAGLRLRGAVLGLPWNRLAVLLAQMRVKMLAPTASALVAVTVPSPQPSGQSRSLCRAVPFGPSGSSGKPGLSPYRRSRILSCFALEEFLSRPFRRTKPAARQMGQRPPPEPWRPLPKTSGHSPPPVSGRIALGSALGIAPCAFCELSMSPSACSTAQGGKGAGSSRFTPDAKAKIIHNTLALLAI